MKTLIIYAHPKTEKDSHASITLREVEQALHAKNEDYEIIDLYKIKYDPILDDKEFIEKNYKNSDTEKFQQKISETEKMIFIYPVWWNGMPAILKGFIDRTFGSGFAFKYQGSIPIKLLKGKKAIVFVTTGAPKIATTLFLGNRFKKNIKYDILGFCGIKSKVYHVGSARAFNTRQHEKIKKEVKKALIKY